MKERRRCRGKSVQLLQDFGATFGPRIPRNGARHLFLPATERQCTRHPALYPGYRALRFPAEACRVAQAP